MLEQCCSRRGGLFALQFLSTPQAHRKTQGSRRSEVPTKSSDGQANGRKGDQIGRLGVRVCDASNDFHQISPGIPLEISQEIFFEITSRIHTNVSHDLTFSRN